MCKNLIANGFKVQGYDIMEGARESASAAGINVVGSIAEAATDADFVVSCLPATAHVQEAMTMEGGVFASARPGTIVLDTSTILPGGSRAMGEAAKAAGMTFIDTPMSGGILGARAGTLSFMCGGDAGHVEAGRPVLNGMGKNIFHCGEAGQGLVAKLSNNLILGINAIAVAEALAMGEKMGGDPKVLSDIISVSTGRCFAVDTYSPIPGYKEGTPACNDYNGGFMIKLIAKDMGLAITAAKEGDAISAETQRAFDIYSHMMELGYGDKDFTYVY
jgi:3-hydroxyisobutyrate dehydrogenase